MPINKTVEKIITEWLNYYIKYHNYASISIGITEGSETYTKTFGSYYKDGRVIEHPVYSIASITKLYTTIEILKLEEKGKLKITDKVKSYLEYFPNSDITIEDLLSYRVSISRDGDFNFWLNTELPTDEEIVKEVTKLQVVRTDKFKYSNLSYAVIGLILKRFDISFQSAEISGIKGYGKLFINGVKEYGYVDYKGFNESFGLYKTIDGITQFASQILNKDNSILKPISWEKLLKVHLKTEGEDDDITLSLKKWKNSAVFEIHGYSFGFVSSMLVDYDLNFSFTVLANSTNEEFAGYFTRTIRKLIEFFKDKEINNESTVNGLYTGKDDDVFVYDCNDFLYIYRPKQVTPFHPANCEIFTKIGENAYILAEKPGDAYENEVASFSFNANGSVIGFKQGGWGYSKVNT